MTDTELRGLWSQARRPAGGANCPPAAVIFDTANGIADTTKVRVVTAHLVGCGACSEDWRLAVAAGPAMLARPGETPSAGSRRFAPRGWGYAAVALALAAAVVLGIRQEPREDPFRDAGTGVVTMSLLAEGDGLPREAFVLRWRSAPGSSIVHVSGPGLDPLHDSASLAGTEYTVPADVLASLPSGTLLYWQVETVGSAGERALSPTFSVRLQ